jgi:hypothetical protein
VWLSIGVFASQCNKQIRIFTDDPDQYTAKLLTDQGTLRPNIFLHPCADAQTLSVSDSLNPWLSTFNNQEVLGSFEI